MLLEQIPPGQKIASATVEATSKPRYSVKLPRQRLMARGFDPQVAEFQTRLAVQKGFNAVSIPVTDLVG